MASKAEVTTAKPKRKYAPRKKKPTAKAKAPKQPKAQNLPEPIDIAAARAQPTPPVMADQDSGGLLSGISNLFAKTESQPESSQPESIAASSTGSTSNSEPLPPESERLLHAVPKSIGEADDPVGPADVSEEDPIAALMAQVAFEPQDVQDVLEEFFESLAVRFESDHWKLTERQARMLGRPSAQLLNSMWAKLQNYLPDILAHWCESTPGATAFILACGIIVAPKITRQVAISRERAAARPLVPESAKQQRPQPVSVPDKPRVGIVID